MTRPAHCPSDPPLRTVELPSGPASYTDEAPSDDELDGQDARGRIVGTVVAIHGLPGSARDFRWIAPCWTTRGLRVVRVELPGFGATPVATAPEPSPETRARFVLDVIDALDIERPILAGHSMGGVVACAVADLVPDRVAALALLSSPGIRPHAMFRRLRLPFRWASRLFAIRSVAAVFAPLNRWLFALSGFHNYPDHELYRTIHGVAATSFPRHAERVGRLTAPTLVAWCDDDPMIETRVSEELAAACPPGPRLRFADGGHNPQKHHAVRIADALSVLLEETSCRNPSS